MRAAALVALVLLAAPALGGTVSLEWQPVVHPQLTGYRVGWGEPGQYTTGSVALPPGAARAVVEVPDCAPLSFAVRAVLTEAGGGEVLGPWSTEVRGLPAPTVARVAATGAGLVDVPLVGTNFEPGMRLRLCPTAARACATCPEFAATVTVQSCTAATVRVRAPVDTVFALTRDDGVCAPFFFALQAQDAPQVRGLTRRELTTGSGGD